MQERTTKNATEIYRDSASDFKSLVESSDVVLLCQEHFRTDCPTTDEVAAIKATLIQDYVTSGSNNKVNKKIVHTLCVS
jgi:hypothetical protein